MKNKLKGTIYILLATIIWGSTFVAQSAGMDYIEPFTFLAVRGLLAIIFMVPAIYLFDGADRKNHIKKWCDPVLWRSGILCGIFLFIATGLQQIGLVYTSAGKAGFITAMYIVIVPFIGVFYGKRPGIAPIISVIIAVVGLYLLSCVGVNSINYGDILLLGCAIAFSFQITIVDRNADRVDCLRFNCIQSLVAAVISAILMLLTETPKPDNIVACWLPLAYAGILSTGVAYSLQVFGQKHLEPTAASLLMSMESVFAIVFSALLLGERLTLWEGIGCALVFFAVIFSQWTPRKLK